MRFTKPAWVVHHDQGTGTKGDQIKRNSIFSVHVHPDGSRIATGGLDARIRIWSTKPILDQSSELANRPPKSLCTLTMHTGPVLTVRWAYSGRWLASGSDDEIVMIWDLDPNGAGKVWGTDDINVEGWKPLKRLPGHESDVTDVAWAPEDRYLASVGLDSKVIIWCGYTLERLRKLDQHQGFVKGVCWDPVGEFLATQSDDKTVKIWRTTDWGLEAEVGKPFEDSPGSTFFRRLSWSPDGAHITASNAMNNNGFVFVAAVIARNLWTSDISLVGHENTVEVAAYNPNIFLRDAHMPAVTANICSVVALGADDRSISVWQTKSARPVIVVKEVFERQILDLSWSQDGLTLYAVSSDGTMAVLSFDANELEGIAPPGVQAKYLQKFGFVPPPLPPGYSHPPLQLTSMISRRTTPPLTPPRASSPMHTFGGSAPPGGGEHVNVLVAKRGNKNRKRVQPTFMGSINSATNGNIPSASNGPSFGARASSLSNGHNAQTTNMSADNGDANASMTNIKLPPPPMQSVSRSTSSQSGSRPHTTYPPPVVDLTADTDMDIGSSAMDMDMDVPITSINTGKGTMKIRRKVSDFAYWEDEVPSKAPKARTLGGDRLREAPVGTPAEIRQVEVPWTGINGGIMEALLAAPTLKTSVSVRIEDTGDLLEATNAANGRGPSEVQYSSDNNIQWLDYVPSPVLAVAGSSKVCAIAMEDGSISIYSKTGRRIMPTMSLGSPCAFLDASKCFVLALTASGRLHVWNVKTQQVAFTPTSIGGLLPVNVTIMSVLVRPNGAPLLQLSNGTALSFDPAIQAFVKVSDAWWAQGSSQWKGRQRSDTGTNGSRGIVAAVEGRITEWIGNDNSADTPRPQWWTAALTLGHLETKLHAARILYSSSEYKQTLLLYAKAIADEGFKGKAEELLKELYGPVYWRQGRSEDGWQSVILGYNKRDLAKDVIAVFARSKTLYKLASDYQDLLKKSTQDE